MTNSEQSDAPPVLLIGPGEPGAAPSLTFRISPGFSTELTDLLASEGISYSRVVELSVGSELAPYLVYLSAGLTGLATVIATICHRNDGKRFRIKTKDGQEYSGQGFTADDALRLLRAAQGDDPGDDASS